MPKPLQFVDSTHLQMGREPWLYFGGCNYLGLSFDLRVRRALIQSVKTRPLQPGASRRTTGEQAEYQRVEKQLARFFQVEAAVVVGSGYLAPLAAVHAVRSTVSHVLLDDQVHAALQDAAAVAGRPVVRFASGDPAALRTALEQLPRDAHPLVACDATRAACGGLNPLPAYLRILPQSGLLLVDDAHGPGAIGPGGRGVCAALGVSDPRVLQTISLAKGIGVTGGAILGSHRWMTALRTGAASFIGSTAPLLSVMAAVETSLQILTHSRRVEQLHANLQLFHTLLPRRSEIISDPQTPVTSIYPSRAAQASALKRSLRRAKIFPSFIRYLNGPPEGFLRLAIQSGHRPAEIRRLAHALAEAFSD